ASSRRGGEAGWRPESRPAWACGERLAGAPRLDRATAERSGRRPARGPAGAAARARARAVGRDRAGRDGAGPDPLAARRGEPRDPGPVATRRLDLDAVRAGAERATAAERCARGEASRRAPSDRGRARAQADGAGDQPRATA